MKTDKIVLTIAFSEPELPFVNISTSGCLHTDIICDAIGHRQRLDTFGELTHMESCNIDSNNSYRELVF